MHTTRITAGLSGLFAVSTFLLMSQLFYGMGVVAGV
jgi:hypothetical protein